MSSFPIFNPAFVLVGIPSLLVAITIHEFAHAWAATRLGDPTPRMQGRLTLNPLSHLDPIGSLMLLFIGFGWGKPVQFDPYNLENPKRDAALISLAGPASNLILAAVISIIFRLVAGPFGSLSVFSNFFMVVIYYNIVLAVFNLLPIHPLDGGKILIGILPRKDALKVDMFLNQYGIFILFLMIFPIWGGVSPVSALLSPIIRVLTAVYLPGSMI